MSRVKDIGKAAIGSLIELARPGLAREIDAGIASGRSLRAKYWILHARLERARLSGNHAAIERALAGFWKGETGDFFYSRFRERFETSFLTVHQILIDALVELDALNGFSRLVEVGCGDGRVLAHCAKRLPGVGQLTGLDINPTIIDINRRTHGGDDRLDFVHADIREWAPAHLGARTILLSYGGVMEYLRESELLSVYRALSRQPGCAVALAEPVDPAHDLERDSASHVFGAEKSFSHNYPHILQQAGFSTVFRRDLDHQGVRWCLLLAAGPGTRTADTSISQSGD